MKKIFITFLFSVVILGCAFAQAPNMFKYQSVVRDNSGNIIASQIVKFRISLLKGSPTGSSSFVEQHTTSTNQFGIANLEIGNGSSQIGSIDTIQCGDSDYFIKIELDPTGSSGYTLMGTTQLLSVPYAMYANNAGNLPKIIAGSSDGGLAPNITSGSGFSIIHPATGTYNITFNTPFTIIPTIVAHAQEGDLSKSPSPIIQNITVNGMTIVTQPYLGGLPVDTITFSFLAIGN